MTVQFEIEDVEPIFIPGDKVKAFGDFGIFMYYEQNEDYAMIEFTSGIQETVRVTKLSRA
jgi:hypothetical protein